MGNPSHRPVRPSWPTDSARWGVPVQLGERRVLHRGRWLWLRAMVWLLLVLFLTAAAFGVPLQAAVDLLPPGNEALEVVGLLVACAAASAATPSPSGWVRDAGPANSRSGRPCPGSSSGRSWVC